MKKKLALFLVLVMMLTLFSSCSNSSSSSTSGGTISATDYSKPVEFEYMGWSNNKLDGSDVIYQAMEKKFNMKLKYTVVPNGDYPSFLSVRLASGDIPELFKTMTPQAADMGIYKGLVADKAIINLSTYIDKYNFTNLKKILDSQKDIQLMKEPDGFYMIPNVVPNSTALYFRQDWNTKLNLTIPKTTAELKTYLDAIVKADPDGKKTTGLTVAGVGALENIFTLFTGTSGDWVKASDGKWVYKIMLPAFKEGVKYVADLYKSGLLDPEFAMLTNTSMQDKLSTGKAAMIILNGTSAWINPMNTALAALKPGASLSFMIPWPSGPAGSVKPSGASFFGAVHISKDATEEQRVRIMSWLDWQSTQDCTDLYYYGVEGKTYSVLEGNKVINPAAKLAVTMGRDLYPMYDIITNGNQYNFLTDPILKAQKTWSDKSCVFDQTVGLATPKTMELSPAFTKIYQKWMINFVTGAKSVDTDWNAMVTEFNNAGMTAYQQEVTNYMASKK